MTADRQALGELGERIAARWLVRAGWRIVDRRFRSGHRDIDLVAARGRTIAFVEVKARRSVRLGDPAEAVGWRKRRELGRSAAVWVSRFGATGWAYRFDVVGVVLDGGRVRVQHLENAFPLPEST